jgi:hypothetical protein
MTILQLSELMGLILVGGFVGSFATWLRMTWEKPEPHPLADEPEKTEISYLKTIASRLMSTEQTETRRWEDLGQSLDKLLQSHAGAEELNSAMFGSIENRLMEHHSWAQANSAKGWAHNEQSIKEHAESVAGVRKLFEDVAKGTSYTATVIGHIYDHLGVGAKKGKRKKKA